MNKNNWTARWIWTEENPKNNENGPGDYPQNCTCTYFRSDPALASIPEAPVLHISADTFYKLYINGQFIGEGPARSDPAWMSYDSYCVKEYLRKGKNIFVVLVCRWIRNGGALFLQMEDNHSVLLYSGGNWKWKKAVEWREWAMHNTSWSFSERIDGRKIDQEVFNPDNTLKEWNEVVILGENRLAMGCASGGNEPPAALQNLPPCPYVYPYLWLEARDIPMLDYMSVYPEKTLKVGETKALKDPFSLDSGLDPVSSKNIGGELISKTEPLKSFQISGINKGFLIKRVSGKAAKAAVIILDFGKLINGHLNFDLTAKEGVVLSLGYSQVLTEKEGLAGEVMCQYAGAQDYGDRYICRAGKQQFEMFHWKHFRYVKLQFDNVTGAIELKKVYARSLHHPGETKGGFESSDSFLNSFFHIAERNTRVLLLDHIVDNNWRERSQYTGDVASEIFSILTILGDVSNIQRYIRSIIRRQHYSGYYPQHFPVHYDHAKHGWSIGFAEHGLETINFLGEYLFYGGNTGLIMEAYPGIRKYLLWLGNYISGQTGLLENPPLVRWIDWADHDYRGVSLILNLWYYSALQYGNRIASEYGRNQDGEEFIGIADKLKYQIRKLFWDQKAGCFSDAFYDGKAGEVHSLLGQALAICYDIGAPEQMERVKGKIMDWKGNLNAVGPNRTIYAARAFCRTGKIEFAVKFLKDYFQPMMEKNSDGLWELQYSAWMQNMKKHGDRVGQNGNICQGGAGAAVFILPAEILGITPLEPAMKSIYIRPELGKLGYAFGRFPTPHGIITMKVNRLAGKSNEVYVEIPKAIKWRMELEKGSRVFLNNQPLAPKDYGAIQLHFNGPLFGKKPIPFKERPDFNIWAS